MNEENSTPGFSAGRFVDVENVVTQQVYLLPPGLPLLGTHCVLPPVRKGQCSASGHRRKWPTSRGRQTPLSLASHPVSTMLVRMVMNAQAALLLLALVSTASAAADRLQCDREALTVPNQCHMSDGKVCFTLQSTAGSSLNTLTLTPIDWNSKGNPSPWR